MCISLDQKSAQLHPPCDTMNNKSQLALLAIVLVVTSNIRTGSALRCWVCSSLVDGVCGDPFNSSISSHTTECAPPRRQHSSYSNSPFQADGISHVCKKVIQRENGALTVVRSCGYEKHPGEACGEETHDRRISARHHRDDVKFCEVCREDGCNTATTLFSLLTSLLASAGVVLLIILG
ncbi:UPAR/Ly6 domain-containing protein crok-like [Cloeon dipterum]|uniref:UPAR/Ly6 domain-containing protein crok-like n=1 Tax=Cloeon dipterum TaxID=197152 RepID=UPI003220028F